ncbi:hypothetical protein M0802_000526 [Mischocyttarus mexicanus]|nr:hypothetical protein M0802_000526 [Mischocyttarus mexicanus]
MGEERKEGRKDRDAFDGAALIRRCIGFPKLGAAEVMGNGVHRHVAMGNSGFPDWKTGGSVEYENSLHDDFLL